MGAHFAKVRVVVPSSLAVACAIAVTVNRPSSPSREEGDDNATCAALNEGAKTSNRLADDQGVHLSRTLIRVDCFRIGNEPTDVVLEQDAVPAKQFAGVADRLAALDRTERLCEGFCQLPIRANSIEQEQRRLIARTMPYRDLERLPADQDLPYLDAAWLHGCRNWSSGTG